MENEEEITSAEQMFYIYNVKGTSGLTCTDDLVCCDYIKVE